MFSSQLYAIFCKLGFVIKFSCNVLLQWSPTNLQVVARFKSFLCQTNAINYIQSIIDMGVTMYTSR
jgi:hypothetical protein